MSTKVCVMCGDEHPASTEWFYESKRNKDGLSGYCKKCCSGYGKNHYKNNIEKYKTRNEKYYQENKEIVLLKGKEWTSKNKEKRSQIDRRYNKNNSDKRREYRVNNKERRSEYNKDYYKRNKEHKLQRSKEWYAQNTERKQQKAREWSVKNKELIKKIGREQKARKRNEDPMFKLNSNIRAAIWRSLKGNKNGAHWELLVGYTITQLKKHLEGQFKHGMSWDNYGEWHVDHKRPMVSFNFTTPNHPGFRQCWALDNLQPLWAEDNLSKSDKWEGTA